MLNKEHIEYLIKDLFKSEKKHFEEVFKLNLDKNFNLNDYEDQCKFLNFCILNNYEEHLFHTIIKLKTLT